MTMNPNAYDDGRTTYPDTISGLEIGVITDAREHKLNDDIGHHAEVTSSFFDEPDVAPIVTTQPGDITVPTEGTPAIIGYRSDGQPLILGTLYNEGQQITPYKPGERRIGHPASDAYIRLKKDGTIHIQHKSKPNKKSAVVKFQSDGGLAMHDHQGYGIEMQNNGEVHIYGKVKQHTSQTLDLTE